jgi:two-component system, OmpR family, sensor histidine kinase KdpD
VRGHLHLYLGTAPGVGKTWALLAQGQRLARSGTDVVVGLAEPHDRQETAARLGDLEVVPPRRMAYRGTSFAEMDLPALLARHPHTVLVDELAHTNVPGSRHDRRWQDVEELLEAGIDVVSALNVQHLESVSDTAEELSGVAVHETVPDEIAAVAERVDLVDLDPDALRERLARIYPPGTAERALTGYFRPGNLAALRALAEQWIREHPPMGGDQERPAASTAPTRRIVAALTGEPEGEHVLRRAAQLAASTGAELVGVHVRNPSGLVEPDPAWLEGQRRLLTECGGRYAQLAAEDVAQAILDFARAEEASQLVLGATRRTRGYELLHGSVINRAIHQAGPIEVHVIPPRRPRKRTLIARLPHFTRPTHRPRVPLPLRRAAVGWLLAFLAPLAITTILLPARASLGLAGALLCALLSVVLTAVVGGARPAIVATIIGVLAADFLYTRPYYSLRVDRLIDIVGLFAFGIVGTTVGLLVDILARQGLQVARSQTEAESLARLVANVITQGTTAPPDLVDAVRRTFDLEGIALLRRTDSGWRTEAAAGTSLPTTPDDAPFTAELSDGRVLALAGTRLTAQDARLLRAFTAELRLGQEETQLEHLRSQRPSGGIDDDRLLGERRNLP